MKPLFIALILLALLVAGYFMMNSSRNATSTEGTPNYTDPARYAE